MDLACRSLQQQPWLSSGIQYRQHTDRRTGKQFPLYWQTGKVVESTRLHTHVDWTLLYAGPRVRQQHQGESPHPPKEQWKGVYHDFSSNCSVPPNHSLPPESIFSSFFSAVNTTSGFEIKGETLAGEFTARCRLLECTTIDLIQSTRNRRALPPSPGQRTAHDVTSPCQEPAKTIPSAPGQNGDGKELGGWKVKVTEDDAKSTGRCSDSENPSCPGKDNRGWTVLLQSVAVSGCEGTCWKPKGQPACAMAKGGWRMQHLTHSTMTRSG